jgi:hypothetical protein
MSAGGAQIVNQLFERGSIGYVDAKQKCGFAGGAMAFGNGGVVLYPFQEPVKVRAVYFSGDQSGDRASQRVWRNDRAVSSYDSPIFKSSHALDHGGTGQADHLGERFHGEPAVRLKLSQDALIDRIDLIQVVASPSSGESRRCRRHKSSKFPGIQERKRRNHLSK